MTLTPRLYVTEQGVTDPGSALEVARELRAHFADLLAQDVISGYQVTPITSDEDFEEEDLPRELIEGVTEGRLPAVYVNMTYDDANPRHTGADHADFLYDHGLRPAWP
jgi:hypothetical protein